MNQVLYNKSLSPQFPAGNRILTQDTGFFK